jgi:hypothetical protein
MTKPVNGTFTGGFRTPDRPDHDGVDVATPKGTPIYAARPHVPGGVSGRPTSRSSAART